MNEKVYQKCDLEGFFKTIKSACLEINPDDFMKAAIKIDIKTKDIKKY